MPKKYSPLVKAILAHGAYIKITEAEALKIVTNLAGLHKQLGDILLGLGTSQLEREQALRLFDQATAQAATEMLASTNTLQFEAWKRGVMSMDTLFSSVELNWVKLPMKLEDPLIQRFLTIDRIKGVTEEMRATIRSTLLNGWMTDQTPQQMMSVITNVIGIRDEAGYRSIGLTGISAKAERIVRTETLAIQNAGAWDGLNSAKERFPDLEDIWLATGDMRTRDDHLAAHGQHVAVGEPFIVGGEFAMFPGDPSLSASQRCNCRCSTAPYRSEWGAVDELIGPLNERIAAQRAERGLK
jgi:hypothetical protein